LLSRVWIYPRILGLRYSSSYVWLAGPLVSIVLLDDILILPYCYQNESRPSRKVGFGTLLIYLPWCSSTGQELLNSSCFSLKYWHKWNSQKWLRNGSWYNFFSSINGHFHRSIFMSKIVVSTWSALIWNFSLFSTDFFIKLNFS